MDREAAYRSEEAIVQSIVAALKSCYDPEIPVDIFELGLIYDIDVDDDKAARIRMTPLSIFDICNCTRFATSDLTPISVSAVSPLLVIFR